MTRPAYVLVVDDDVDTCHNLTDILVDQGYRVDAAQDGLAALALIDRNPYDIALLDLKMPGMNGIELYREIKKRRAGMVGIILTAYATNAAAEEALAAGAWRVLSKPVDLGRLLELVDEALGQPLVLIIDDDHELCANLWDLLRERGYRVAVAHDQQEASNALGGADVRVVLIDMRLPRGDGQSVFRLVRAAAPTARTVLITAHRSEMDDRIQMILNEGADAVCYKPFDVPELLHTLQRLEQPCN